MKRLPIKAAKDVAKQYDLDQVILLALDRKTGIEHVVTYGRTLLDCAQAAEGGNRIKREVLRWPEELCKAKPARVRRRERKND